MAGRTAVKTPTGQPGPRKPRSFDAGNVSFRQLVGSPVGSIHGLTVKPGFGAAVAHDRDRIYYRGTYVGWCDYRMLSHIVLDREVAPVIVEEIQVATLKRDQAYGLMPLQRRVFFTATSGHYVRRNKR